MDNTLILVKPHIREELDSSRISRDLISSMLDYETIVLESSLLVMNKNKYGVGRVKKTLNKLVNEGLLDTGYESGTRWYCFRRECKNHYTGEITLNEELRTQLKRFVGIYED